MKNQTREEWLQERREYIGASDAASVVNGGRYGCALKLFNVKTGVKPDFDESEKAEFRRGRRLEGIAASYYEEVTGRKVFFSEQSFVPGKKHLRVSMDRIVYKTEDAETKKNPGYLEIKTVGRFSINSIKKNGLPEDYIIQLQFGLAVTKYKWGSYAIYCPETDELLHWDVDADKVLGEILLEKADDFYTLNVSCGIAPDRLPEGSRQCSGCPFEYSCWSSGATKSNAGVFDRPDLAGLAAKLAEVKGMESESSDAAEAIKAEILEAIKEQPGTYRAGGYEFKFTVNTSKRFQGDLLKKSNPDLYEKFRMDSTTKTLSKPKLI